MLLLLSFCVMSPHLGSRCLDQPCVAQKRHGQVDENNTCGELSIEWLSPINEHRRDK